MAGAGPRGVVTSAPARGFGSMPISALTLVGYFLGREPPVEFFRTPAAPLSWLGSVAPMTGAATIGLASIHASAI